MAYLSILKWSHRSQRYFVWPILVSLFKEYTGMRNTQNEIKFNIKESCKIDLDF
jgi:hypothetical protein